MSECRLDALLLVSMSRKIVSSTPSSSLVVIALLVDDRTLLLLAVAGEDNRVDDDLAWPLARAIRPVDSMAQADMCTD